MEKILAILEKFIEILALIFTGRWRPVPPA